MLVCETLAKSKKYVTNFEGAEIKFLRSDKWCIELYKNKTTEQTPWLLVRKRTIPTERPPLVGEVSATFADRGCGVVSPTDPPQSLISVF
jgi:hypothetical protein